MPQGTIKKGRGRYAKATKKGNKTIDIIYNEGRMLLTDELDFLVDMEQVLKNYFGCG
jgi:hypothetical protein